MKTNIIIAGVGGQGILTIASIIDLAAMNLGLHVKQAEVHGMSQRGGAVESHLRISDAEIFSDLIPRGTADVILSIEPMESLRYLPFLAPDGIIITAIEPYDNIENYPDPSLVLKEIEAAARHVFVDASVLAKAAGSVKTFNVVMLGAALPFLGIAQGEIERAITLLFASKGEAVIEMNISALRKGCANTENVVTVIHPLK